MTSRRFNVYGNLKMHAVSHVLQAYSEIAEGGFGLLVPYPYLGMAQSLLADKGIEIGAQSVSEQPQGAYTSQVSAEMLSEIGISCVMVGHSEVRALGVDVSKQLAQVYDQGFKIIYCVGEDSDAYEAGRRDDVLIEQLNALPGLDNVTVAYEPVWSIGTGRVASIDDINQAVDVIRGHLAESFPSISGDIDVLYGGSINKNNCLEVFKQTRINGFLIGGASLKPEIMLEVIRLCK